MISAVICTYNRERFISGVLDSIVRQSIDKSLYEIIFVNNNSTDNTKKVYEKFVSTHSEIKSYYFDELQQGLSYSRNRGVKEAHGEYIAFIDDDAFLDENYFKIVYDYFSNHKDVLALGGKILLHYEGVRPKWATKYIESLFGYFNFGDNEKQFGSGLYPRGSNMVFRKSCFQKYGDFNVNLGRMGNTLISGEEKEFFSRFITLEKIMYVPGAIVHHIVPEARTTKEFIKKQAQSIGFSESIRVKNDKAKKLNRAISEIIKWNATFMLFFWYLITLQASKGIMLLKFRYWISKGLFGKINFK